MGVNFWSHILVGLTGGVIGGLVGLAVGYHISRRIHFLLKEELDILLKKYKKVKGHK